jgi:uncharacterized protein
MLYRWLGRTGLRVSVISLGCVPLGGLRLPEGIPLVQRAIELGINYLDTARRYRNAENIIGHALQGQRHKVHISSKVPDKTRDEAWRSLEESLTMLQTDHLDNCHLHMLRDTEDLEIRVGPGGALQALVEARSQGVVRHIGVTSHKSSTLLEALTRFDFETIMVPMNIVEREPLVDLIPWCQTHEIGVTIMKPVATGLLPGPLALKWLVNQPIATAAPGITTLEELEMNAAVGNLEDLTVGAEEQTQIKVLQQRLEHRRCRICYDCAPCPQEINIGYALGTDIMYDHYRTMGHEAFAAFPWTTEAMAGDLAAKEMAIVRIESCDRCGICEMRCSYGLPIMDMLQGLLPALRDVVSIYRIRLGLSPAS